MTAETQPLGIYDDTKRLRGWGFEMALETWPSGNGDDSGDLAAGDWRQQWRLGQGKMYTTVETWQVGNEVTTGDYCRWGVETTVETQGLGI